MAEMMKMKRRMGNGRGGEEDGKRGRGEEETRSGKTFEQK
jgi:hypothetical protein